jgi:hypothetical protein
MIGVPNMIGATRLVAMASGLMLVLCGPAPAQQSGSGRTAAPLDINQRQNQHQAAQKPAAAKPAAAKPAVATRRQDFTPPPSRQWSLDDALPKDSTARRREVPQPAPSLGRIPVEGGTFGFSTETKVNAYELPDRSRIRGLEPKSDDPSYLGLSLSLTTDNKSFLSRPSASGW